jgi:hypothetical protein
MKNKTKRKIVRITLGTLSALTLILALHIFIVTRPGKVTEQTIAMARIDFQQDIAPDDAAKVSAWLSGQPGVTNVLCNPESNIAVFTYHPIQSNPDQFADEISGHLHYKCQRYVPSAAALSSGCPMKSPSILKRMASIF